MLVRRRVKDYLWFVAIENNSQTIFVPNIADNNMQFKLLVNLPQLIGDIEDTILPMSKQNQRGRVVARDLPT